MALPFVFSKGEIIKNTNNYTDIHAVMAKYYEGVEKANLGLLGTVFHPDWLMKDTDTPNANYLNVEDKSTFIKRVQNHGPYNSYAQSRDVVNISIAYDELALVRVNKDPSRNSTIFFLFKIVGNWIIMDKVFMNPREEYNQAPAIRNSFNEIEQLIKKYYEAAALGNKETLSELLHEKWDLKYLTKEGKLYIENKDNFLTRVSANKYIDYSLLLSIEIYHDGLAVARMDMASFQKTDFIILLKINGIWKIVTERRSFKL